MSGIPARQYNLSREDLWLYCGGKPIYDLFPRNASGTCALVTLLLPIQLIPLTLEEIPNIEPKLERRKRGLSWDTLDTTYIDAIGVPRGVPNEYKQVDQVGAGFESLFCAHCTMNNNVDRINYIHYNVQKLGNYTEAELKAVHEQLAATLLMAFQNRIAIDMLLAEKGVCSIFGQQCFTYIANNTAP